MPMLHPLFAPAGNLAPILNDVAWDQTPLGPVASWPQSLQTAVSICLSSQFPMILWWGPDLVQIYNVAYRPILGDKHPRSMGQRGADCWSEIWSIIEPLLMGVIERGASTWAEDQMLPLSRYGYTEECFFTFSYSPIRGESAGFGGVFCAVTETTARVLGERRLRTLSALGTSGATVEEDVPGIVMAALGANRSDHPFALLYGAAAADGTFPLIAQVGLEPGSPLAPLVLGTDGAPAGGHPWPVPAAARQGGALHVTGLGDLGLPGGPWPEAAREAWILPVAGPTAGTVAAWLVLGVSPRRAWDPAYRSYGDLVTRAIATTIATARAYSEEKRRAHELAQLDHAKTAFFSNVSHEFRTPLTLMLAPIEDGLADPDHPLTGVQRERMEILHRNALRLLNLVNGLLDFSRIEAGRVQALYRPTDLAALTEDLVSTFRSAMDRAGLALEVACPRLPQPVHVDRDMWEKIVLNLMSNAFKHTFAGSIRVALRADGRSAVLTIADTGVGIPADELPRLFERFHRVQGARSRTHEGTGIGLALVQELARLHGGAVEVASEVDRGSVFTVRIPLGTAHLPRDQVRGDAGDGGLPRRAGAFAEEALGWLPDESHQVASATGSGSRAAGAATAPAAAAHSAAREPAGRVLLADDNADMRRYVRGLLERYWTVEVVADGALALAAARARPPDLIISDVMMPNLDGLGLLAALRDDERTRSIPVILLSARAGEESGIAGLNAGADDYLTKPFSALELIARVRAHLHLKRQRDEAARAVRYQKDQYATLLNQAPVGVYLVDADLRLREVNPVARPVFNSIPGDIIGRDFVEVIHQLWPKAEADNVVAIFRNTLATGESHQVPEWGSIHPETRQMVYFDWRIDRITLPDGGFGVVAYFRDITIQVRAREVLAHHANELAKANVELDHFASIASHDLQQPLRMISSFADLVSMKYAPQLDQRGKEWLARISEGADRMRALVSAVLHYSQVGRQRVERAAVPLARIADEAVEALQQEIAGRRAQVIYHDLPVVTGDRTRLTQLLQNLIANSLKFSLPERPPVIAIAATDVGSQWEIRVSDNGIGIKAEAQGQLFQIFKRLHNPEQYPGSGIGLATCKKIVEQHGGTIGIESVAGEGTTVRFTLPKETAEAAP